MPAEADRPAIKGADRGADTANVPLWPNSSTVSGRRDHTLSWIRRQLGLEVIRHVAVMLVGFPTLPEGWSAETFAERAHALHGAAEAVAARHGGSVSSQPGGARAIIYWGHLAGNAADVATAQAAAEDLLQQPSWSTVASAVIGAGTALVAHCPVGGPQSKPHVTSAVAEAAIGLHITTRPGDVALMPEAALLLAARQHQKAARDTAADWPAVGVNPNCREQAIRALAADPNCSAFRPGALGAIVEAADGDTGAALLIGRNIAAGAIAFDMLPRLAETTNPVSLEMSKTCDTTTELSCLLAAAAVCGDCIDASILAEALSMRAEDLEPLLDELAERGFLRPPTVDRRHKWRHERRIYRFEGRLLRAVAAGRIPGPRRRALHLGIAEALERRTQSYWSTNPDSVPAAAIAQHFTDAGRPASAVRWWRRAAEQAIASSAPIFAVAHLETAIAALSKDTGAPNSPTEAEALARLLGPQLAAARGNGASEVLSTYQRYAMLHARNQTGAAPTSADTFDILWGQLSCHLVQGDMRIAEEAARRMMTCAEDSGTDDKLLLAHRMFGLCEFLLGRLESAARHYDYVLSHYDARQHGSLRHTYASDQAALGYAHLFWTRSLLGEQEQAEPLAKAALESAERMNHPHTTAHTVCVLAAAYVSCGREDAAMPLAIAGRAVAQRNGFPYWSAWSEIVLAGTEHGSCESLFADAIAAYTATGARQILPLAHGLLARRLLTDEKPSPALEAIEKGLSQAHATGVRVFDPELMRLYGIASVAAGSGGGAKPAGFGD